MNASTSTLHGFDPPPSNYPQFAHTQRPTNGIEKSDLHFFGGFTFQCHVAADRGRSLRGRPNPRGIPFVRLWP